MSELLVVLLTLFTEHSIAVWTSSYFQRISRRLSDIELDRIAKLVEAQTDREAAEIRSGQKSLAQFSFVVPELGAIVMTQ